MQRPYMARRRLRHAQEGATAGNACASSGTAGADPCACPVFAALADMGQARGHRR